MSSLREDLAALADEHAAHHFGYYGGCTLCRTQDAYAALRTMLDRYPPEVEGGEAGIRANERNRVAALIEDSAETLSKFAETRKGTLLLVALMLRMDATTHSTSLAARPDTAEGEAP